VELGQLRNEQLQLAVTVVKSVDKKTSFNEVKARQLTKPSDRRLSAKLVPTFADRGCRVVSATDPYGR
jgi:hypothetical protein